jgi:hypothetical protein
MPRRPVEFALAGSSSLQSIRCPFAAGWQVAPFWSSFIILRLLSDGIMNPLVIAWLA